MRTPGARAGITVTTRGTAIEALTIHLLAIAPAGVGVCCLAAERRRSRGAELAAGLLMLAAMIDAVWTRAVPSVAWAAVLVIAALALGLRYGRARGVGRATMPEDRAMVVHAAAGAIVMAAVTLAMTAGASDAAAGTVSAAGAHGHGAAPGSPAAIVGAGYVVASVVLVLRARRGLARVQYAAMATSVGLMTVSVLI